MIKYDYETEKLMLEYFARLSEPLRRQYAYLESQKLGHGGKSYVSKLLAISHKAIRKGESEMNNPELLGRIPAGRQRRPGGGRKKFCLCS